MTLFQIRQLREALIEIRYRLHRDGVAVVLRQFRSKLQALGSLEDKSGCEFDREFDTDTERRVPLWRLQIDSGNRLEGVRYQTLAPFLIRRAIESLPIDRKEFSFCDLGSGKGRALMIASEYPFRRVVGVEFSQELHAVAADNLQKSLSSKRVCPDVLTLNIDATDYQFPSGNLVIFLFNPFGATVMRGVLANLKVSLMLKERTVWIIYFNAVFARLIEDSGLFNRFEASSSAVIFRHEGDLELR